MTLQTILFDLDGTLYQDHTFYNEYFKILEQESKLPVSAQECIQFIEEVIAGKHVKMNTYYDVRNVHVNSMEELKSLLPSLQLTCDVRSLSLEEAKQYIYMGDLWSLIFLLANAFQFSEEACNRTFQKTREDMVQYVQENKQLKEVLLELKKKYTLILCSNTYEASAVPFVKALGLYDCFHHRHYSTRKPYGLTDALNTYIPDWKKEVASLLSIGDHWFNDLKLIEQLGGQIMLIQPYEKVNEVENVPVCRDMEDMISFLKTLL